ncbi:STAS domain-containing protein [bacterium]|nr:STAS domain-containing protein [bacterium]
MDIKVETKDIENIVKLVSLSGEIDVYTSPKVKETINALIEGGSYNLIINLEQVRYIDSTGLGVLIGALKKVREHEGNIYLVCVDQQIKKVFTITGLVKIFKIFENNEEAISSFR